MTTGASSSLPTAPSARFVAGNDVLPFEAEGGARLSLPEGFTAGGGDQLFFRPQDAALVGPDEQSPAGSADISGMIAFREFLGSSVRYQIQAGSNTLATDVPFHGGDALYAIGETVTIAIPAQRLRWLNG